MTSNCVLLTLYDEIDESTFINNWKNEFWILIQVMKYNSRLSANAITKENCCPVLYCSKLVRNWVFLHTTRIMFNVALWNRATIIGWKTWNISEKDYRDRLRLNESYGLLRSGSCLQPLWNSIIPISNQKGGVVDSVWILLFIRLAKQKRSKES